MTSYAQEITDHYVKAWNNKPIYRRWEDGPVDALPTGFRVLEFPPTSQRQMWTYATCELSQPSDAAPIELHFFSPVQTQAHVELLTAIAHYHRTSTPLDLGHTVNLGRAWLEGSNCDYAMISLPYLDGPELENLLSDEAGKTIHFLWLVPITRQERDYKIAHGQDALEEKLEAANFNYLDPRRASVV